jgi:5-oxoprolinase (ATP-hydrolysing) subunit A
VSAAWIDLNCDLGEGTPGDLALLDIVTSANIACGGHAGDERSMRETVRAAAARGVAVGAHPGYPDRARFGRFDLNMTRSQIEAAVKSQVAALDAIATEEGTHVGHIKPHGALYHAAMQRPDVARAIANAAGGFAVLVGLAGAAGLDVWRGLGVSVAAEAFADRRYERDGSLQSRSGAGSLITDPSLAAEQAVRIARGQGVVASDGAVVAVHAQSICVHSDTPGAVEVARAVRAALERANVTVRSLQAGAANR